MTLATSNMAATQPLIVVVDDDHSIAKSLARLLVSSGYAVKTFGSAGEYLASLPATPPQCFVLDVHMPEMTGFELQDRLTAMESCAPVIFITAHDTPHTRERAHRSGTFGLLLKPFDTEALLRAIREAVGCQPYNPE